MKEFEETILRKCALPDSESISQESLSPDERERAPVAQQQSRLIPYRGLSLRQAKARAMEQFMREYLSRLLFIHQGNVSGAARGAVTDRRTFQRLLRKYGLERSEFLKAA